MSTGKTFSTKYLLDSNNSKGVEGQILSSTSSGIDWIHLSELQGVDGSGTANYLPIWTDGDTLGDSILSSTGGDLILNGSDDNPYIYINPSGGDIGDTARVVFNNRGEIGWIDSAITLTDGGANKDIKLKVNTGSIFLQTSNLTRMTVVDGGNVGIGTSAPDQRFHVNSGATNHVAKFESTDSIAEITIKDDTKYTRLLNISTDFKIMPNDGASEFIFEGDTGNFLNPNHIRLVDGGKVEFGDSQDLELTHDGTNSWITNYTGNIIIQNNANDQDIIFKSDDGSGGAENYIQIDGSAGRTLFNKHIRVNDDVQVQVGSSANFLLSHNGTNSYVSNYTGDLYIENAHDDGDIIFKSDNGSGGTTPYLKLWGAIESLAVYKDMLFVNDGNGGKLKFGASQDLQIYHDGSHSYVKDTGTGSLILEGTDLQLKSAGDEFFMYGAADGQVSLYYNGIKKFETSSTGTTVTGNGVFSGALSPRVKATGNAETGYPGFMLSNTNQEYEIIVAGNDSNKLKIRSVTDSSDLINIESNGNATFEGDVLVQKTGDVYLTLESTDISTSEEAAIKYSNQSTGGNYWWAGLNQSANYSLAYGTAYSGANVKMEISTTGDTTLSGSVTADSFIKDGGTSSQFLKADGSVDSTAYSTTDTTYVSSDFTHDDLTGFVADEHINWKTASQGTIHITNLPATALTSVQTAVSQVAQLALTTQEGDVVVRSDENKTYMHNGGTAGTMADFTLLATPTDSVTSVNGATGAVTFDHDDLTGFVANEHIDWTVDQGATNIHSGNYTNTTYTSSDFNHDDLTGFVANEHIDWTTDQGATNIHVNNITGYLKDTTDTFTGSLAIESGNVTLQEGNKIVFDQDGDGFANIFSDQNNASVMIYNSVNGHHFKNGDDGEFDFVKASTFIRDGGTSSQFMKADGSVDSNTYITGSTLSNYVNTTTTQTVGGTKTFSDNLGVGSLSPTSGISSTRVLKVSSSGNSEVNVDHTDGGTGSDIGLFSFSRNGDHLAHMKATHDGNTTSAFLSFHTQASGGSYTNVSSNERMRITSSGDIGIGKTAPGFKVDIVGGSNNGLRVGESASSNSWNRLGLLSYVTEAQANALSDHSFIYTTNPSSGTEDAFSKYGGLVIQGRDDGNSSFAIRLGDGSGHDTRMFMGATGVTTFSNTVTAQNFILSSDGRLKENVEDVDNSHIDVDWKTFEMKSNEGQKRYGVIAQELEEKHPEFVRTDDKGMKSVAYVDLLIAKIAELEARLEKLEK